MFKHIFKHNINTLIVVKTTINLTLNSSVKMINTTVNHLAF